MHPSQETTTHPSPTLYELFPKIYNQPSRTPQSNKSFLDVSKSERKTKQRFRRNLLKNSTKDDKESNIGSESNSDSSTSVSDMDTKEG